MKSILTEHPKELATTWAEATEGRAQSIDAVLEHAGLNLDEEKKSSTEHWSIVLLATI